MNLYEEIKKIKNMMYEQKNEVQNQLNWLRSYVMSPKYLERLKLEFPGKDQKFIENERNIRYKNLENIEYRTHFVKSISSKPGYISGKMIPKEYSGQYYDFKKEKWVNDKWQKDSKGYDKPGHVYLEKEYDPKKWNPYPGFETIPVHEFGHIVDDAGFRIPSTTVNKIKNYTQINPVLGSSYKINNQEFDYPSTPSEFINRLQSVRYLLNKEKIYNPSQEKFNDIHYNKMINNPLIKNNDHYQSIFNSLKGSENEKKKNFIDLMNTIAFNSNNKNNNLS